MTLRAQERSVESLVQQSAHTQTNTLTYSYGKQTTAMMTMTVDDEGNPTHSCSAATLGGVPSRSGTRGPNGKRLLPVSLHGNTEHWQAVALHTETWTKFIQKFQIY